MRVGRNTLLRPLLAAALTWVGVPDGVTVPPASAIAAASPSSTAAARSTTEAVVTQRIFLDLRIIKRFDVEVLEDAAVRGRIVVGLYGKDAPKASARFLEFVEGTTGQFASSRGGPSCALFAHWNHEVGPCTLVDPRLRLARRRRIRHI